MNRGLKGMVSISSDAILGHQDLPPPAPDPPLSDDAKPPVEGPSGATARTATLMRV